MFETIGLVEIGVIGLIPLILAAAYFIWMHIQDKGWWQYRHKVIISYERGDKFHEEETRGRHEVGKNGVVIAYKLMNGRILQTIDDKMLTAQGKLYLFSSGINEYLPMTPSKQVIRYENVDPETGARNEKLVNAALFLPFLRSDMNHQILNAHLELATHYTTLGLLEKYKEVIGSAIVLIIIIVGLFFASQLIGNLLDASKIIATALSAIAERISCANYIVDNVPAVPPA